MVPFQPTFLAIQWSPELVTVASQAEVTLVPEGKSHSTVQELMLLVPVFLMVHWPPKPVPQSLVLVKVAVAVVAAWAGGGESDHAGQGEQQGRESRRGPVSEAHAAPPSSVGMSGA
ncbi:hypothetical protein GCM10020256_22820 [Streptomyces thermocoprophilus]